MRLTGLVVATSALSSLTAIPAAAATLELSPVAPVRNLAALPRVNVTNLSLPGPGAYRVSGLVRMEAPIVEIRGITNSQQMSWSGTGPQVVPFTSFEMHEGIGAAPAIAVRGGRIEALTVTPMEFV
jgi:hypothetical protein